MGWLAVLAALGAYGVALDHMKWGSAFKGECLAAQGRVTHEAVALGLAGIALGLILPAIVVR